MPSRSRSRYTAIAVGLVAGAMALTACANHGNSAGGTAANTNSGSPGGMSGKVFLLLPDQTTIRFEQFDAPYIKAGLAKLAPKVDLVVENADNDVQKQLSQAQGAIAEGAKALIYVPVSPTQAAGVLNLASTAHVPVIDYAHEGDGGPMYAYVTVPFTQIGQVQGKAAAQYLNATYQKTHQPVRLAEIYGDPSFLFYTQIVAGYNQYLTPMINKGEVKVVCKADALLYLPSNAQREMQQCLTSTNNNVNAVLAMNDDTGGGALAAADSAKVRIPMYGGYDATLAGVQRVAAGIEPVDMAAPYKVMANAAAELAVDAITGAKPSSSLLNGTFNNHYKNGVPTAYLQSVVITQQNLNQTVIQADLYTKTQICTNSVASASSFCTGG